VDLCSSMNIPCHAISNHRLALSTAVKLGGAGLHRSAVQKQYLDNIDRCGGLVDVCVVTTNSWEDVKLAVALTKFNGVVSILGFPGRGQLTLERSSFEYNLVYDRQLSLVSAGFGPEKLGAGHEESGVLSNDMEKILDEINVGVLNSNLLIGRTMPATDLNHALTALSRKRDFTGTILLDWQNASFM
jgi:threonine dehydrogenase-like Zn-dependent dehydrogenase